MVLHNLRIAWKSLRRNPILSGLIVCGIALGIALSTTFTAIRHAFARDPIPQKSAVVHYVRVDSWDPARPHPHRSHIPSQMTYRDVREIMKSTIPVRQSAMFKSSLVVTPDPKVARPFKEMVRLCFSDFFPMFDVPFKYGGPWDRKSDETSEPVVVLSEALNAKLFGGRDSVGQRFKMEDREFRVVGVLDRWTPSVKFYDLTQNFINEPEGIYAPFNLVVPMKLQTFGNSDGWGPSPSTPGWEGILSSETVWLQMWVELPNPAAKTAYEDFLRAYVLEQKKHGRFPRPINNRVSSVPELMDDFQVVPKETNAMVIVSLLFLAVCALNLVGLLLGKFLARAPEVGVRRALGASRVDIFMQHVVECELIGLLGGLVGLPLTLISLSALNAWLKTTAARSDFFHLDVTMLLVSLGLSLAAGLAAGVYPAWRTCRLAPAIHLKVQ